MAPAESSYDVVHDVLLCNVYELMWMATRSGT